MRKSALLLSILLAVAVSATGADAAKKKMKRMAAAAPAPVASKINGYAWPGTPYPVALTASSKSCYGCNP